MAGGDVFKSVTASYHNETTTQRQFHYRTLRVRNCPHVGLFVFERDLNDKQQKELI